MRFTISEPVYKSSCLFIINEPFEKMRKDVERQACNAMDIVDWDRLATAGGFMIKVHMQNYDTSMLIYLPQFHWNPSDMAIVGHEVIHLGISILDENGITVCPENSEVLTYVCEFYLREVFWRLNPKKRKK